MDSIAPTLDTDITQAGWISDTVMLNTWPFYCSTRSRGHIDVLSQRGMAFFIVSPVMAPQHFSCRYDRMRTPIDAHLTVNNRFTDILEFPRQVSGWGSFLQSSSLMTSAFLRDRSACDDLFTYLWYSLIDSLTETFPSVLTFLDVADT